MEPDQIAAHLENLDRIVAALKASPLAPRIRIFGSALHSLLPGDIDCAYEGPSGLPKAERDEALSAILDMAFAKGNYGCLDPFLLGAGDSLLARSDDRPAAWVKAAAKTRDGLVAAARAGTSVLEFDRDFVAEWKAFRDGSDEVLREAADWYYDVAELYEDEDLDPDDHLEVVKRAFTSSDCDDFAAVLAEMTGWKTVRMAWSDPDGGFGHHTLVRDDKGHLVDVTGWTGTYDLRRRHGIKGDIKESLVLPSPQTLGDAIGDDGIDLGKKRIVEVIRSLPYEPFVKGELYEIARRPVAGADFPYPVDVPSP